jgi:hypothetical protein
VSCLAERRGDPWPGCAGTPGPWRCRRRCQPMLRACRAGLLLAAWGHILCKARRARRPASAALPHCSIRTQPCAVRRVCQTQIACSRAVSRWRQGAEHADHLQVRSADCVASRCDAGSQAQPCTHTAWRLSVGMRAAVRLLIMRPLVFCSISQLVDAHHHLHKVPVALQPQHATSRAGIPHHLHTRGPTAATRSCMLPTACEQASWQQRARRWPGCRTAVLSMLPLASALPSGAQSRSCTSSVCDLQRRGTHCAEAQAQKVMDCCCTLPIFVWQAELLWQADCMPEDGSLPVGVLAVQLLHLGTPQEQFATVAA